MTSIFKNLITKNERYEIYDLQLEEAPDMTVSCTVLYPSQSTRGHKHEVQGEFYIFIKGYGKIELDGKVTEVSGDMRDVIYVKPGQFHKVINNSQFEPFEFICMFSGPAQRPTL